MYWNQNEIERIAEIFTKNIFSLSNIDRCCLIENNRNLIVNVPATGTLIDAIRLVHEFIHYYFHSQCPKAEYYYFDELFSIYFETRMADYLVECGFNDEEVYNLLQYRKNSDGINNILSEATWFTCCLESRKKLGKLTPYNILPDERLEEAILLSKSMESYDNSICTLDKEELRKQFCLGIIYSITELFNKIDYVSDISYTLGTYISDHYQSIKMDEIINNSLNNINSDEFSPIAIMESIRKEISIQNKQKKYDE